MGRGQCAPQRLLQALCPSLGVSSLLSAARVRGRMKQRDGLGMQEARGFALRECSNMDGNSERYQARTTYRRVV